MPSLNLTWRTLRHAEGFYTSEIEAQRRRPVRTFLPTGYEPNYAYPLLVFLHGHGGNEEQILRLAPRISRRNFVGIGLRGPEALGIRKDGRHGYGWGTSGNHGTLVEEYVFRAVEQTRRHYHVHSERIILVGFCEGATQAYRLALTHPEKFGGVVSLNGHMNRQSCPRLRLPEVRGMKVFVGHGIANAIVPSTYARENARLLSTAGLDVRLHTYPTTHRLHPEMLRDVNRWIVDLCTSWGESLSPSSAADDLPRSRGRWRFRASARG